MTPGDRELEALLRQALSDEAGRVEPAGDGLSRIRERTAARRWWARWSVPALALAGATAVIAAVTVLPSVLTRDGEQRPIVPAGVGSTSAPAPSSAPTTPTPTPTAVPGTPSRSPAVSGTATSGGTPPTASAPSSAPGQLGDRQTVWPYASRSEGAARADEDVRNGTYPNLRDPARTALDFVGSFIGREGLTAVRLDAYPPGLRMLVSRDGHPVSTVFLVRVRAGDDAPYVVVGASRATIEPQDSLMISPLPRLQGTVPFVVQGLVRRASGSEDPRLVLELREPGSSGALARTAVTVPLDGKLLAGWSGTLSPSAAPTGTGVVAGWTVEPDGRVLEFVAAPTAP